MKKFKLIVFIAVVPYLTTIGCGRESPKERLSGRSDEAPGASAVELSYGKDPLQTLDYWKPNQNGSPLVVFVHSGGWKRGDKSNATGKDKSKHYFEQGYAFVSINYRLTEIGVQNKGTDLNGT